MSNESFEMKRFRKFNDSLPEDYKWKGGSRSSYFAWRKDLEVKKGRKPPYMEYEVIRDMIPATPEEANWIVPTSNPPHPLPCRYKLSWGGGLWKYNAVFLGIKESGYEIDVEGVGGGKMIVSNVQIREGKYHVPPKEVNERTPPYTLVEVRNLRHDWTRGYRFSYIDKDSGSYVCYPIDRFGSQGAMRLFIDCRLDTSLDDDVPGRDCPVGTPVEVRDDVQGDWRGDRVFKCINDDDNEDDEGNVYKYTTTYQDSGEEANWVYCRIPRVRPYSRTQASEPSYAEMSQVPGEISEQKKILLNIKEQLGL